MEVGGNSVGYRGGIGREGKGGEGERRGWIWSKRKYVCIKFSTKRRSGELQHSLLKELSSAHIAYRKVRMRFSLGFSMATGCKTQTIKKCIF